MTLNAPVIVSTAIILAILSASWYAFYASYLRRHQKNDRKTIISHIRPYTDTNRMRISCDATLSDNEDPIKNILPYCRPDTTSIP